MAAMTIYLKNLKKSSSLEPLDSVWTDCIEIWYIERKWKKLKKCIFSSPGRNPEELMHYPPPPPPPPPPSALALASASTFTLKFFKSLYFLNISMGLAHIWHNDRYTSKVYIHNILPWPIDHKVKNWVTRSNLRKT